MRLHLPRQSRFRSNGKKGKSKIHFHTCVFPRASSSLHLFAARQCIAHIDLPPTCIFDEGKKSEIKAPTMVVVRHRPSQFPSHEIRQVSLLHPGSPQSTTKSTPESSSRIWCPNGEPNTSTTRSMARPSCSGAIRANPENFLDG